MKCEICGNDYDKAFEVIHQGKRHVFDCLECAAQGIAPICGHCSNRVLGHGVETNGAIYCCAHCARSEGEKGLKDRAA